MPKTLSDIFGPEAYREIDESRWYLIGVIDELYHHHRNTSVSNIRRVIFKRLDQRPRWQEKFYLGYDSSIVDVIQGMYRSGVLELAPTSNGHKLYKLTQNGKENLAYFKKKMKIFK